VDLAARIEQLDELVQQAKSMPLSSSVLVNRDELLDIIKEMRESLPEEVKQARWVVKDREDLLAKAREKSDALLDKAREEQLRMATKEAVVQRAYEEAERIAAQANEDAKRTRLDTEDYVDAKLAQFEIVMRQIIENMEKIRGAMDKTVGKVEQGREKLRGTTTYPAAALGSEEEEE